MRKVGALASLRLQLSSLPLHFATSWDRDWMLVLQEKAVASHSSPLAWKIPWTEEPGGLQSMGSLRVRHDWSDSAVAAASSPLSTQSCTSESKQHPDEASLVLQEKTIAFYLYPLLAKLTYVHHILAPEAAARGSVFLQSHA